MQIRKRNGRAVLWRASWVPKGTDGNAHGYRTEKYLGSLPLDATELPAALAGKLSADEKVLLAARVFEPARLAAAERERSAAAREADPVWRIEGALRLLDEALTRSRQSPVAPELLERLHGAIARWPARPARSAPSSGGDGPAVEALHQVISAMEHAASAVRAGAPRAVAAGKVRTSPAYHAWSVIADHINNSKRGHLAAGAAGRRRGQAARHRLRLARPTRPTGLPGTSPAPAAGGPPSRAASVPIHSACVCMR